MAKVTFTLEDKDGLVQMGVDFGPGADKNSPAHKAAHILTQWMTDLMSMPIEAPTVVINAESIKGRFSEAQHVQHDDGLCWVSCLHRGDCIWILIDEWHERTLWGAA